jgi:hypothetical protein
LPSENSKAFIHRVQTYFPRFATPKSSVFSPLSSTTMRRQNVHHSNV